MINYLKNKTKFSSNKMSNILNEYSKFQTKTEKDPLRFGIRYMALGLGGEVGEVLNEVKKFERDDNCILTEKRKTKIISEMGDVFWYFQGLANKLDISIEDIINNNIDKLSKKNDLN